MKTDSPDVKSSGHAPPSARPAPSPLRLTILLGVLVVVAGALLYDRVIAPPRVKAADDKLHETILKHNELALKPSITKAGENGVSAAAGEAGGMLYSEDIQKILGMAPTKVEKTEFYTIEHYRWWGWIPRNGNFITVLYTGNPEKRHYSTHCANRMPEDELLPGKLKYDKTTVDLTSSPNSATVAIPAGPPAGRMPGTMGPPGAEGGKGKGRPQGKADKAGSESKAAEEGAKKVEEPPASDEAKKSDEPAKAEEAPKPKEADGDGGKKEPAKETTDESK
ncbi:MAG: hypothetical protein ACR2FY_03610 [Pirellulaceae bacterium]